MCFEQKLNSRHQSHETVLQVDRAHPPALSPGETICPPEAGGSNRQQAGSALAEMRGADPLIICLTRTGQIAPPLGIPEVTKIPLIVLLYNDTTFLRLIKCFLVLSRICRLSHLSPLVAFAWSPFCLHKNFHYFANCNNAFIIIGYNRDEQGSFVRGWRGHSVANIK